MKTNSQVFIALPFIQKSKLSRALLPKNDSYHYWQYIITKLGKIISDGASPRKALVLLYQ